jgi:phosphoglycolate phosphatase-like HAD superfamily hydrolase
LKAASKVAGIQIQGSSRAGGKTDWQIMNELFDGQDCDPETIRQALTELNKLTEVELMANPISATKNAAAILRDTGKQGWINGVLTGNTLNRTQAKLKSANLQNLINQSFIFNGENAANRFEAVDFARKELLKQKIMNIVIIGDTPLDIQAAKSAIIPCVAVATGGFSINELAVFEPELLLDDLDTGSDSLLGFLKIQFAVK